MTTLLWFKLLQLSLLTGRPVCLSRGISLAVFTVAKVMVALLCRIYAQRTCQRSKRLHSDIKVSLIAVSIIVRGAIKDHL